MACDNKICQIGADYFCQWVPEQCRERLIAVKNRAIRPQGCRSLADTLYDDAVWLVGAFECKDLFLAVRLHDKGIDFAVGNGMQN